MKSSLQRRVARLESAALQQSARLSKPVSARSFWKQVYTRMQLKRESFEVAFQALVIHVDDHQLDEFIAEAEASLRALDLEPEMNQATVDIATQGEPCMTLPYELPPGMDRTG